MPNISLQAGKEKRSIEDLIRRKKYHISVMVRSPSISSAITDSVAIYYEIRTARLQEC
jgi:hypothetical protein